MRVRIAVVGSGIAGLASAWLLSRRHEVQLLEAQPRLGGHSNTVAVRDTSGRMHGIDTGFVVYNETTYPLLVRLFDELGIATQPSDMSWSLTCRRCHLEYSGNARGMFAQPSRVLDPGHIRMVADIARFNRIARQIVASNAHESRTLGQFVGDTGLGAEFQHHYLAPMAAAIWSSGTVTIDKFPIAPLLTFFSNHGLLKMSGHLAWRTVVGGSASYVNKLAADLSGSIRVGSEVVGVERSPDDVNVTLGDGTRLMADAIVIACHADEALEILRDASPDEKEVLGAWDYSHNTAVLHTDASVLPARAAARAAWNYAVDDCHAPAEQASLHYSMNRLQQLDTRDEFVVSLNPAVTPSPQHAIRTMSYTHPIYTAESVQTQERITELNGANRTFFAGAYHRNGFHEDGLWSAVRVADALGVTWPR